MKLESIHIQNFKRFANLTVKGLQPTVKLVVLTGPNGCGKTSLFDAFNYWMRLSARQGFHYDKDYYERHTEEDKQDEQLVISREQKTWENIIPKFCGIAEDIRINPDACKKAFYVRSSYRYSPDFNIKGLKPLDDVLKNSSGPTTLMLTDTRVQDNYQRMVGEAIRALFDESVSEGKTRAEIRDELIGEVRQAMSTVFKDLVLEGVGNPLENGSFYFTKGVTSSFHYKNLSGGEKAAFDLLLDFIIKRKVFDDTIYCIDEPELHMHSRLQAKLLEVMFNLIPDNCQLWIATHSIGMARKAADLHKDNPEQVAFIDFSDRDFDQAVTLTPIQPNRLFWDKMFETALDDLGALVAPEYVVFCEGTRLDEDMWRPSFDATVYSKIFGDEFPFVKFIPLGGKRDVKTYSKMFGAILGSRFKTSLRRKKHALRRGAIHRARPGAGYVQGAINCAPTCIPNVITVRHR